MKKVCLNRVIEDVKLKSQIAHNLNHLSLFTGAGGGELGALLHSMGVIERRISNVARQ